MITKEHDRMNKLTITKKRGIDLYCNLYNATPDRLYHERHARVLPHPADIVNEKLGNVVNSYLSVCNDREVDGSPLDGKEERIKALVLEVDSFYDAMFLVIKSLTPPSSEDNKDAIKWLREAGSRPAKTFIGDTKKQHAPFRVMANKLKHDHAAIMYLTVTNHHNVDVHGFYIQSVVGEGDRRGPDPEVHKELQRNVATAFSYNHFLLYTVGSLVHYMHRLNKCLFADKPSEHVPLNLLFTLACSASKLSQEFFPDEYRRSYARVVSQNDGYSVTPNYRYKINQNEEVGSIRSVRCGMSVNARTNKSHAIVPYFPLLNR